MTPPALAGGNLMNGLRITRPNQVWPIDITHVAILDWRSRCVLDWRVSDSMEIGFAPDACRGTSEKAVPEIMNSGQGSHLPARNTPDYFWRRERKSAWTVAVEPMATFS